MMDDDRPLHLDAPSGPQQVPTRKARADDGREIRHTWLVRTARLIADDVAHLCIPRNISGKSVILQLFQPRPRAARYELESPNGVRYSLKPAWAEGELECFEFLNDEGLLTLSDDLRINDAKYEIRLERQIMGVLRVEGEAIEISVIDLSQHGAYVECSGRLNLMQLVRIRIDGLPEIGATILWRQRNRYVLIFEQSCRFEELARRFTPEIWPDNPVDIKKIG